MILKTIILCLWISSGVISQTVCPADRSSWPANLDCPFPFRTLEPIELDTSRFKLINVTTNLTLTVSISEEHYLTNTGCRIILTPISSRPKTSVTGGPLGNDIYVFYNLIYYFAGTPGGCASGQVDGICSPLEARATFRNTKYSTFDEAKNKRDGLCIVVDRILVEGYQPTPAFTPFAEKLASIRLPGSKVLVTSLPAFAWFNDFSRVQYYYSSPGAYTIGMNSVQYDSATMIVFPNGFAPAISLTEFAYFQNVTNSVGTQMTNVLSAFQARLRPLVEIIGTAIIYIP